MTNEDKQILKDVLIEGMPVLFLGSGFSYGALMKDGNMIPRASELKEMLLDHFIKRMPDLDDRDITEIRGMNLREVCDAIKSSGLSEELNSYLTDCFSNCTPAGYHRKISAYPWKKIYTVNIDDIVERLLKRTRRSVVVQNKNKKKYVPDDAAEIIKLHGCINEPDESYVFSDDEYTSLISGPLEYRLNDLTNDLQNRNFIFVGASLDEPDIKYYFSIYKNAGYQLGRGKIICINPDPSFALRKTIQNYGGHIINATSEDFLNYLENLNYNPDDLEKSLSRLEYGGVYSYNKIISSQKKDLYESSIYQGYESKWRDLTEEWLFPSPAYKDLTQLIDRANFDDNDVYCIVIHGKRFCGKGCILKLLSQYLEKNGYDVLVYNGVKLDVDSLIDYIGTSPNGKFALMIPSAAFYYKDIESLFKKSIDGKKLLVTTTSRDYYHFRKKYYLDDNPYNEYEVVDSINKEYAESIYDTLLKKGYTGWLSRDKKIAVNQICGKKNLVNLFSSLSFGSGFRNRFNEDFVQIKKNDDINRLYVQLAIFDKADLEFYPKNLLWGKYRLLFSQDGSSDEGKDEGEVVVDYISYDDKGLSLKNKLLNEIVWDNTNNEIKLECIVETLQKISPYVSESENSYWRIIFESLTYEKWLRKSADFSNEDILELFYLLKNYYGEISYYWLQLGLTEQDNGEFQKAQTHLDMAAEIRPRAFQIQHAIARNYLRHANALNTYVEAEPLYSLGRKKMLDLINSNEFHKKRARDFSVHCYVSESIKYILKFQNKPTRSQIRELHNCLEKMIDKEDKYYKSLITEFARFLKKTDTMGCVQLHLEDSLLLELTQIDDSDYITDSYQ